MKKSGRNHTAGEIAALMGQKIIGALSIPEIEQNVLESIALAGVAFRGNAPWPPRPVAAFVRTRNGTIANAPTGKPVNYGIGFDR
jgi:hypothetical protein